MHTEEDLVMHGARLRCADHARASLDARMRHGRHLPKGTLHHFARTGRSGRAHFFLLRHRAHTQRHFVPSSEPGPHNLRNVFGLCCFHSERSACVGPPNGEKCLSASLSGAPCSRPSLLPRHAAALSGRTLHPRTTATDYATYLRA